MTIRTDTLPNGLRVLTEHMDGLGSAAVGIWVNAGARHETPQENGIAHFLEHMAFKGTTTRSALDIAEAIENVGGYINAYTSRESTAYYARVLGEDVPLALEVIGDILVNPIFDTREIEVERGVILSEIGQSHDTPDDVIFDWLQEVAYPGQAMGRSILGTPDRVRSFAQADLRAFTGRCYGPSQMMLVGAGAVDHDAIMDLATALLGDRPASPPPPAEAARYQGGERREIKALEQAHIAIGFEGPAARDDDVYVGHIYASALGGGMSSRLFQEVREKRGLCYSIFAQSSAYDDTGTLTVYAGTGEAELAGLCGVIGDEMRRIAGDLTQAEVDRARAQMKAGLVMALESPSSRAERMARMMALWGRVPDLAEMVARIDAVTLADTRAFAERVCTTAEPALALYGPVASAPDRATLQARLRG